jgi:ubiquinone/menaquinone biosynthesis C-methylase UbiE
MIELPDTEIERLMAPYIHAEVEASDRQWTRERDRLTAKSRKMRRRGVIKELVGRGRSQADVRKDYQDKIWPTYELAKRLVPPGQSTAIVWRDRHFFAGDMATKRVHLALFMNAITATKPKHVLEVGSGVGLNILVLAARFPEIEFVGGELTPAGVEATNAVAAEGIPETMATFSPQPPERPSGALENVRAMEADASALPFSDEEFDLVFSAHALEQMEAIRTAAQSEMARVSGSHVVMIEPFADWNTSEMRQNFILAKRYFQGSISDLEGLGLTIDTVTGDIPSKLTMGMGFAMAHKS